MASRMWNTANVIGAQEVLIHGSFAPDGVNPPTDVRGQGVASAVRLGIGIYEVTLDDEYLSLYSGVAGIQSADGLTDVYAQLGPSANSPTANAFVLTIFTRGSAGAIDLPADPNNRVNFSLFFRNSTAMGG